MGRGRWGLGEEKEVLFAASRAGRRLYLLDPETLQPLQEYSLPAGAVHLALSGGPEPHLQIGLEPALYHLDTWQPIPADRWDWPFGPRRSAEWGPRGEVGWTRFAITAEGVQMTVRTPQGDQTRRLALPIQGRPVELAALPGRLLLTTDKGLLYILDPVGEKMLATLPVSEAPPSMAVVGNLLYATDPVRNELVVVEVPEGKLRKRVPAPEGPVAVAAYNPTWWTKDHQPAPLLFVACQKAKTVAVVDPAAERVTKSIALPFEPTALQVLMPPNPEWWPEIPSERLGTELTVRLAVLPRPMILRQDGKIVPSDQIFSIPMQPHNHTSLKQPDGSEIAVSADNNHTLRYRLLRDGKPAAERWVDVSMVTDTPGAGPVVDWGALAIGGQPWHRDVWMNPEQMIFLVAESPEFWSWNAPVLRFENGSGSFLVEMKTAVQLDALRLEPVAPVGLEIVGLAPAEVPARYRAVFYAEEPVRLKLSLYLLESGISLKGELAVRVFNYIDEQVWTDRWEEHFGGQQRRSERILELPLSQTGVFRLEAEFRSSAGKAEKTFYFLQMPRLERPRLLARPAQWAEAKKIMAKYPHLFQRYFQWLAEQMQTAGFLPTSLLREEFLSSLPPEQKKLANQGGWRRYDLAYRLLGVQLACHLLPEPDPNPFQQSILQVLRSGRSDSYCHFHHHGPFFPGFDAAFLDLAAAELGEQAEPVQKLREFLAGRFGDMNVLGWNLAAMHDPPTPRERMLL